MTKTYAVYEGDLFVGELVMTPARVREIEAKAGYTLVATEGSR